MYVKKWLALTLAGAVLAMGFSGCDRTIIEHQFHTNTITETIIEEVPVEIEADLSYQKLIDFFQEGEIELGLGVERLPLNRDEFENDSMYKQWLDDLTQEDIEEFFEVNMGMKLEIARKIDHPAPETEFLIAKEVLPTWMEGITQMYDELMKYKEENGWDWEQYKNNLDMYGIKGLAIYLRIIEIEEEDGSIGEMYASVHLQPHN